MSSRILVVTGTRADFGLVTPVIHAMQSYDDLDTHIAVAGAHLLGNEPTAKEVEQLFPVAARIPMQRENKTGRLEDAHALGRGIAGVSQAIQTLEPNWIVVLGDRIEAFAAAAAASVGGIPIAHIHGGDRAEGVADEAMRHAITKLSHLHFPATKQSAERILRMGEHEHTVFTVGSPAIDTLAHCAPQPEVFQQYNAPEAIVLLHPIGRSRNDEYNAAMQTLQGLQGKRVLALHPNYDPGREGILQAFDDWQKNNDSNRFQCIAHLARNIFVGVLCTLRDTGGVLVGNSSAGLIEAAALQLPVVDIGTRQAGRERANNAVHANETANAVKTAFEQACAIDRDAIAHPYGDGNAGVRIAEKLATFSPDQRAALLRKRNAY